jgi:MerR family transcriptional regulator, thiopeptide resistance regulator
MDEKHWKNPSERTQAGHRLYDESDIRRLYEIRALRDLGVSLGDIPIEPMTMFEKYYTAEQLEQRRQQFGQERMDQFHRDWEELIAAARAEEAAGTDPSDPRMQEIARRWIELIELFTGGDEQILNGLKTMMNEEGPEKATRGAVDPKLQANVSEAIG